VFRHHAESVYLRGGGSKDGEGASMEPESSQQQSPRPPGEAIPATPPMAVIGIGASSGGLSALQRFFAQVPADSGMAFVVILHLSPEYKSHAAAVIQHATTIPVTQVTEAVPLVPNHVYVIPLTADATSVLETLTMVEREVSSQENLWY